MIGLSSALRLLQAGHPVTIIAKDFPVPFETADPKDLINYSSVWAGAHNRWVIPPNTTEQADHSMALATYRHMEQLVSQHPECGIHFTKGIEYLESPPEVYRELTPQKAVKLGIIDFRILPQHELPDQVTWGCEYKTWCATQWYTVYSYFASLSCWEARQSRRNSARRWRYET